MVRIIVCGIMLAGILPFGFISDNQGFLRAGAGDFVSVPGLGIYGKSVSLSIMHHRYGSGAHESHGLFKSLAVQKIIVAAQVIDVYGVIPFIVSGDSCVCCRFNRYRVFSFRNPRVGVLL